MESIDERCRHYFPQEWSVDHVWDEDAEFTTLWQQPMHTGCALREGEFHFGKHLAFTTSVNKNRQRLREVLISCDEDEKRLKAEVDAKMAIYEAIGCFRKKSWLERVFG